MDTVINKAEYSGTVKAPPSKSDCHRLLICAGLSEGKSVIHGVSQSQDIAATLDCIKALGADCTVEGDTVTVRGCDPRGRGETDLYCRESGSTARFFIPICMLSDKKARLYGSKTLLSRPFDIYERIALGQGIGFENDGEKISIEGKLSGGCFRVPGDVSSQFISGLMFALPLLDGYNVIELEPPVLSAPYIRMTAQTLEKFGIHTELSENKILIRGGQKYVPAEQTVCGDWSNGAFFFTMAALGHDIEVEGLDEDSFQGDSVIIKYLSRLGRCRATVDLNQCPDLAPVLMAYAGAMYGGYFIGTNRLKLKESDRGNAMKDELKKFGIEVTVGDDFISVDAPSELAAPSEPIDSHNDHRIAMACAVLLTFVGGSISGSEAVSKSYPDFFEVLRSLEK